MTQSVYILKKDNSGRYVVIEQLPVGVYFAGEKYSQRSYPDCVFYVAYTPEEAEENANP